MILSLNDQLLVTFRPRNTIEQLALSLIAQNRCKIYPFKEFVVHYWRQTLALPVVLAEFFSSLERSMSAEQLAHACGAFSIDEEKLQRIQESLKPRGFKKFTGKLRASAKKRLIDLRGWFFWHPRSNA